MTVLCMAGYVYCCHHADVLLYVYPCFLLFTYIIHSSHWQYPWRHCCPFARININHPLIWFCVVLLPFVIWRSHVLYELWNLCDKFYVNIQEGMNHFHVRITLMFLLLWINPKPLYSRVFIVCIMWEECNKVLFSIVVVLQFEPGPRSIFSCHKNHCFLPYHTINYRKPYCILCTKCTCSRHSVFVTLYRSVLW